MSTRPVGAVAVALATFVFGAVAFAARPSPTATVTVFAAASLSAAFTEIGRAFERRRPGAAVRFNFAGSQQLAAQIAQGAPADVFASADERWMRFVRDGGHVAGEPAGFAGNRLIVIVPKANPARLRGLPDLARHGVRVVIAADAVPAGHYAREALRRLEREPGYPPGYARRVLANVASEEETVRAVAARVQLGEADAGFVYVSDVTPALRRVTTVFELPPAAQVRARYPIATLSGARNAADARAFVALVQSPEGQRVLARHGFLSADTTAWRP